MADKDGDGSKLDISLLRTPIQISGKPIEQVLNSIHYGSPELRCLLMDECDLIFECKVCRALFRDLPNFISHKRAYCTKSALETRHMTFAGLPEEKVVVIQPQAPEETNSGLPSPSPQPKSVRPNLEQTVMRIQSGELGRSEAYRVYTEAAEKLQRQKEGMKVATIRTTAIPTNKNAVFIDVNMASVNIHERQQQVNNGVISAYDQKRNDSSVTVIKRKTGERQNTTRSVRKSTKQERQSSEPQKLLMEQLKEIQHKVKQKVAAAHDKTAQQKKVRNASQNNSSQKDTVNPAVNESSQKTLASANTTRAQKKLADSSSLKVLSGDNVQAAVASDEETKDNVKEKADSKEVKYALVKHKVDSKICLNAAKENKSLTSIAITVASKRKRPSKRVPLCSKCNSVFATTKSLRYHEQIHHSGKRTFYPCPYCSSVFYYFFGITRHLFRNHSKSLDEINAMRRQLRERSFTKPLSSPLCTKEVGRSTRSLGRGQLLNMSTDAPSASETSASSDKLSKNTSGDGGDTPETSSKLARPKIQQDSNILREYLTSPKISALKTEDIISAKEDKGDPRPIRLKNRQQQVHHESSRNSGKTTKLIGSPLRVSTPVSSSPIVSRSQENVSHLCPKCHRAFRRKISCKNHIKVCNAKGSGVQKPVRTPNTRHRGQQLTPESATFNNNKHTKMKNKNKTSSHDSKEEVIVKTDNQSKSPVNIPEKNGRNVEIESSDRKTSLRNSQVSSVDTTSNSVQRSSSVDSVVSSDTSRNRSRERNSAARDERDSSVESTQSNMDGKSPRSRRNVLSRYASLAQLSKSPSKLDISVKSDESCEKFSDCQQVEAGENSSGAGNTFLQNGRGKTSRDDTEDDNLKKEITSKKASEGKNLSPVSSVVKTRPDMCRNDIKNIGDLVQDLAHPNENDTTLAAEVNYADTSQKLLQSSLTSKRSLDKQTIQLTLQCSPEKLSSKTSSSSTLKLPDSANRSDLVSDAPLGSCKDEVTENICDVSPRAVISEVKDTEEDKPESDLDNCAINSDKIKLSTVDLNSTQDFKKDLTIKTGEQLDKTNFEHTATGNNQSMLEVQLDSDIKSAENNLNMLQKAPLNNSDYNQGTSDTLMEMESAEQDQEEKKLPEMLGVECVSRTEDLTLPEDKANDLKKPELISKEQAVEEVDKNYGSSRNVKQVPVNAKSKEIKPQNVPPVAVISALSERPKRKRKVPSRNKDAEEMLSKIHNHNRNVAPVKKTKTILEIKASESPKKKLKAETTKTETVTSAEVDKDVHHIKDELETHVKNRRLLQKDESLELESADDDSDELFGKVKGRFVSNRMYVLEKCGSKNKRLKCFDQAKVYRMIDEEQLKCLECGESCSQVCNLRRHVIRQHLKWSRFKCKLCKFECYDRSECATHLIRGHKNRAISLRNVNQFILDLVRQGSHARSLKKIETIKVKQKSAGQEGNIYARPAVKKTHRLSQRAEDESSSASATEEISGKRGIKIDNEQPQILTTEEPIPPAVPLESTSSFATASKKQPNSFTSSPKVPAQSKQSTQDQASSKAGLDAAGKAARKTLPFNISTRNSPRTFDTRPYNPVCDDAAAEMEKLQPIIGKETTQENILPSEKCSQKLNTRSNGRMDKDVPKSEIEFVSPVFGEPTNTDTVQKNRNIFEHIKLESTSSPSAVTSVVTTTTSVSKPASSSSQELNVSSNLRHQNSSPRIIEVKVESPKNISDSSNKKATGVKTEKPKIPNVFRSPQLNVSNSPSATVNLDRLRKPTKLECGEQVSLPGNRGSSSSELIARLNLPPGKYASAQVIDCTNLQRKHMSVPSSSSGVAKITPSDNLKVTQRSAGTSKETVGSSSGLSLAAALTKGGHIFTTVATSFIVSHGQAGKFIVYTRPVGAKDSTTVSSGTKQSPVSSPLPVASSAAGAKDSTTVSSGTKQSPMSSPLPVASSAAAADVKTSDVNPQKDSQSQGSLVEDVLSPGTFVIRKHYL